MPEVRYGSLPFREAIEFFRGKVDVPTARWADLWQAQHDTGFMIAGAAKADLLADFREAIDKAIAEGTTIAEFRQDFDQIVTRYGWSYNGGRGWRTRVIYDTNLRQAYNAGREIQMADPELRRRRPYGLYRHGDSAHPRPLHLAWDGLVLPLDDPWWDTHTPMNGWGCKCKKFMVGERDLRRLGKSGPDRAPDDGSYEWIDKATGQVHEVPAGIDPGFGYRPGGTQVERLRQQLAGKAAKLPAPIGRQLRQDIDDPPSAPAHGVWPIDSEAVFSTVKGVDQAAIEQALRAMPGAERQVDALAEFLQAHPIKALFLKSNEMLGGQAARAIEPAVSAFLGTRGIGAWTWRRRRINGFTSSATEHVVVKAPAAANVRRKLKPEEMPGQVAEVLRARAANEGPISFRPQGTSGPEVRLHWSFSQRMLEALGEEARVLSTFIHELGHQVHFWAGAPAATGTAVTKYAMSNKYEWHAEHFVAWLLNRDALAAWNREIAEHFDQLVARATANAAKAAR